MSFYDQLEKLCHDNGVTPTSVVQALGMSKGTMSNWKKGGMPNGDAIVRFSEHFHVSADYLLFGKEHKTFLSQEEQEWLDLYRQLPLEARCEFRGELKGYLKRMNKENQSLENTYKTGTTNSTK